MLLSIFFIVIFGLIFAELAEKLHLPRLIGMLLAGIVIGPFGLGLLDSTILLISGDLRKIALVIILIKAGLSLNLQELKQVGRPALFMSFLPASFEILGYCILAPLIFDLSMADSLVMGAVLAAVSPAVVVPRMVYLIESGYGTGQSIPQLILAGASLDDIFVIVLFSTFLNMALSGQMNYMNLLNIPISIILGILAGLIVGWILANLFKYLRFPISHYEIIIILTCSLGLVAAETIFERFIAFSGLIAVLTMAGALKGSVTGSINEKLSRKFGQLWQVAEIFLFVLVGAAVDIRYIGTNVSAVVGIIFLTLLFRVVGIVLSLSKTSLNRKERLFCVGAYMPKATVQAAIGSIPLAMGLPTGNIILTVAVMGIIVTAPLGAIFIDNFYPTLLLKDYERNK